jgi:uncharacterized RDD family membrane protein YckC
MGEVPEESDRQYAEWFAWARREVSADERVCHGVATAAVEAAGENADREDVERIARASVLGRAASLSGRASQRRREYARWYDWARRELGGDDAEAWHRGARAALEKAEQGGPEEDVALVATRAADAAASFPTRRLRPLDGGQASPESTPDQLVPAPPASEDDFYVSLGPRAAAGLVDCALLSAAMLVMVSAMYAVFGLGQNGAPAGFWAYVVVFGLALTWFYRTATQGSNLQATVGGWAIGLAVIDKSGKSLTFNRAAVRSLASVGSLGFGLAVAWRSPHHQALQDLVSGTRVIRREYASVAGSAISYLAKNARTLSSTVS